MNSETDAAINPINPKRESNDLYASIGLSLVLRPKATSAVSNVKPNVNNNNIYTSTNNPPPFCAARYGNLQMLPRPTAEPAAAITNPNFPVN